jgi:tRNA(Ile2) C34 agmatinyltransferase TiaS
VSAANRSAVQSSGNPRCPRCHWADRIHAMATADVYHCGFCGTVWQERRPSVITTEQPLRGAWTDPTTTRFDRVGEETAP